MHSNSTRILEGPPWSDQLYGSQGSPIRVSSASKKSSSIFAEDLFTHQEVRAVVHGCLMIEGSNVVVHGDEHELRVGEATGWRESSLPTTRPCLISRSIDRSKDRRYIGAPSKGGGHLQRSQRTRGSGQRERERQRASSLQKRFVTCIIYRVSSQKNLNDKNTILTFVQKYIGLTQHFLMINQILIIALAYADTNQPLLK